MARRCCWLRSVPIGGAASRAERPLTGEQLVEHQPEGIDVASGRHRVARQLFGCHVGRSAGANLRSGEPIACHGEPEVRNAHSTLAVEHHIGGFQVPVQDSPLVSGSQPGTQLLSDIERLLFRQPADTAQQGRQIFTIDVLHRQEVLTVDLAHIVNSANVRVGDLARDADLTQQSLDAALVAVERHRKELERHRRAQLEIVGSGRPRPCRHGRDVRPRGSDPRSACRARSVAPPRSRLPCSQSARPLRSQSAWAHRSRPSLEGLS